jgi:carbon storage regulator
MLVLSRRIGEEIMIAGDIRVTVVAVNERVRLGITAPSSVDVSRQELIARCSERAALPISTRNWENQ